MIAVNKKAVSPMVATILLIAFAIALGAVVMNWGKGYIEEKAEFVQGGAATAPASCDSIVFSVLDTGSTQACVSENEIRAYIQNDGTEINNLKASVIASGGVSNNDNLLSSVLKSADAINIRIPYSPASGEIIQVKLIPQIEVDGNLEFCTAQGITLENIKDC